MMSLRPKEINANKQTQHLRVGTKLRRDEGEVYEEGEVIKVLQGGLHYRVRWLTYEEVICSGDANDMYLYQTNFVTSFIILKSLIKCVAHPKLLFIFIPCAFMIFQYAVLNLNIFHLCFFISCRHSYPHAELLTFL